MIEIQNYSYSIIEGGAWDFDNSETGFSLTVPTVQGFALVHVFIHPDDPTKNLTVLQFVKAGQLHGRRLSGMAYSKRHCVALANRFAAEVAT